MWFRNELSSLAEVSLYAASTYNDDNGYCNGDGDDDDDDDDKYVKWICCEQIAQLHHFLIKKTKWVHLV